MKKIMKSIYKTEHRFNAAAESFFFHHPFLGYLAAVIGMPIFIIMAVFAGTTILAFPLMLLFGGI